jgi:hypothetical protein
MIASRHAKMIMWRAIYGVRGTAAIDRPLVGRVNVQLAKRHRAAVSPEVI